MLMKTHMIKEIKLSIIVILSVVALFTLSYLVYRIRTPHKETYQKTLYDSTSSSNIDYAVVLMPNPIYNSRKLESGQTYIAVFTDYIEVDYNYIFEGSEKSKIKGKYDITLELEAFNGKDENRIILWTKRYPKIKSGTFDIKDSTVSQQEHMTIALGDYLEFVRKLDESFPISSNRRLILTFKTHMTSELGHGTVTNDHINRLYIPLINSYYDITGNLQDIKEKPITQKKTYIVPISKEAIITLSVIFFFLLLGLTYSIFFIKIRPVNKRKREISTIFKKYSSRFVSLQMEIELLVVDKPIFYVRTFDGLVRLSDELVQPILYTYKESLVEINAFYVIHQDNIYCYAFDHSCISSEEQDNLLDLMENVAVDSE